MGGAPAVARLHERGERTVREHIDGFLEKVVGPDGRERSSFEEIGTFTHSMRPEDRPTTPGDGKIGGVGTINGGRPVMVGGDDITVKRGSTAEVGSRRIARLVDLAVRKGMPFVYFGQTGGARIPDIMGSEGFAELPSMTEFSGRPPRSPWPPPSWGPASVPRRSSPP